ncbi:DUF975 family protein [Hazenella sp. IB182357]|uniref:DUF975 family protein n=1 Tax=Polycladospora coralii TaxID=2771432 RepID=A0A926N579_9BACL|nr:DUF975 family protein [Polycladospora coralii]MBD1371524.1 DUF975 family protein [Polycladospora coralii]
MNRLKRSDLKRLGLDALKGNWGTVIGSLFILIAIYGAIAILFILIGGTPDPNKIFTKFDGFNLVSQLLTTGAFQLGFIAIFMHIARQQKVSVSILFKYYKSGNLYVKSLIWYILYSIYLLLWTLLLIIPGFIKSYSYAMSSYILNDNPELSANQAITQSRKMMDGHKLDLFLLHLSFIGWIILGIITFGIGFIWITPYMQATEAMFYRNLKGELHNQ